MVLNAQSYLSWQAGTEGTEERCPPDHLSQHTPETLGKWKPSPDPTAYARCHKWGGQSFEPYFTHGLAFHETPTNLCRTLAFSQIALPYSQPIQDVRKPLYQATCYPSINLLLKQKSYLHEGTTFGFFIGTCLQTIPTYTFKSCQDVLLKNPRISKFFTRFLLKRGLCPFLALT